VGNAEEWPRMKCWLGWWEGMFRRREMLRAEPLLLRLMPDWLVAQSDQFVEGSLVPRYIEAEIVPSSTLTLVMH